MPPMSVSGHSINGPSVDYHVKVAQAGETDIDEDGKQKRARVSKQYLNETFKKVLTEWKDVPAAVLCFPYMDGESHTDDRELCTSILQDLGKNIITIEQYVQQGDVLYPNQIIVDYIVNVSSFEIPLVIAVADRLLYGAYLLLTSRARVKLIMVSSHVESRSTIEDVKKKYPTVRLFIAH